MSSERSLVADLAPRSELDALSQAFVGLHLRHRKATSKHVTARAVHRWNTRVPQLYRFANRLQPPQPGFPTTGSVSISAARERALRCVAAPALCTGSEPRAYQSPERKRVGPKTASVHEDRACSQRPRLFAKTQLVHKDPALALGALIGSADRVRTLLAASRRRKKIKKEVGFGGCGVVAFWHITRADGHSERSRPDGDA